LRQLDERSGAVAAQPAAKRKAPARVPWAGVSLAVLFIGTVVVMGGWILPRTGQATVTSFFETDLDSGRQLRQLQRAADRDPTAENLLALGDFYWEAGDVEGVSETYGTALDTLSPPPAEAAKRLGLLQMTEEPAAALELLQLANEVGPGDAETLFYLAEMQLVFGDFEASRDSWREFLTLGDQAGGGEEARNRLELLDEIIPLYAELEEDGESPELLAALGEAWWQAGEQEIAVDNYFRILTEHDPFDVTALSRVGQMLFTAGRTEEGVLLLERAVTEGDVDAEALLFLGNGYYTLEDWEVAIDTWTAYVEAVGPEEAGRVPGLIEDAETRLAGGEPEGSPELPATPADAGVPVPADDGQQTSTGQT
ncbi:MAG TPA: tetratricopeptide repeat protein, partial [Deinococcales bacterium]|nr:tetratricopeptide repeat protein [Deinococcales bacterium]